MGGPRVGDDVCGQRNQLYGSHWSFQIPQASAQTKFADCGYLHSGLARSRGARTHATLQNRQLRARFSSSSSVAASIVDHSAHACDDDPLIPNIALVSTRYNAWLHSLESSINCWALTVTTPESTGGKKAHCLTTTKRSAPLTEHFCTS